MNNTDKIVCRQLATLLVEHGVRRVFISPGSRNAPIIVAIARCQGLQSTVIVDERSAAFMAMGYGLISGEPVAIVCTSGTALLNYAPAVAEAYYRKVPLIVISADRPMEWIDQDDSQTLRQQGALANYVKLSCDIPEITTQNLQWYANRLINDALLSATTGRKSPVHINIQLDAPLGGIRDYAHEPTRVVSVIEPDSSLRTEVAESLSERIHSSKKVLIIAGFNSPDTVLNTALSELAKLQNVAVLTETISNLHSSHFISSIDSVLCRLSSLQRDDLRPDIVITLGGALVSRFVKEYLRSLPPKQHWHVGIAHTTIDCFQALTTRIEIDPGIFFSQIVKCIKKDIVSDYALKWRSFYEKAVTKHKSYVKEAGWSDMKAFDIILNAIPKVWNLQLSNGTPIRYAQLFGDLGMHRSDCNRGVSGIDGCTSTAIGASMAYEGSTLLITGDTSAQYDIGALSNVSAAPNLKIIVICNGGGGIFRFIKATSHLDELDSYLAFTPNLPLQGLSEAYGINYYAANDEKTLKSTLKDFISDSSRTSILAVYTPPIESAEILKNYFKN